MGGGVFRVLVVEFFVVVVVVEVEGHGGIWVGEQGGWFLEILGLKPGLALMAEFGDPRGVGF